MKQHTSGDRFGKTLDNFNVAQRNWWVANRGARTESALKLAA